MRREWYALGEQMTEHAAGCEKCAWWLHVDEGDDLDEWGLCVTGRDMVLEMYRLAMAVSAN